VGAPLLVRGLVPGPPKPPSPHKSGPANIHSRSRLSIHCGTRQHYVQWQRFATMMTDRLVASRSPVPSSSSSNSASASAPHSWRHRLTSLPAPSARPLLDREPLRPTAPGEPRKLPEAGKLRRRDTAGDTALMSEMRECAQNVYQLHMFIVHKNYVHPSNLSTVQRTYQCEKGTNVETYIWKSLFHRTMVWTYTIIIRQSNLTKLKYVYKNKLLTIYTLKGSMMILIYCFECHLIH